MIRYNNENILVFLLALLIPLNYLGRALFYIDLVLILIFYIINSSVKKNFILPLKSLYFLGLIIIFYFISLIVNFFNPTEDYSRNINMILILLPFLYIISYIFNESTQVRENYLFFEKILFFSISFLSLVLILSYFTKIDIFESLKNMTYIEFIQWKYHSRQNLFAVCIPLLINYFKNNNNKMTLILLFIIYIATILSGGRTAIIVITVGTLSFMYYQSFSNKNINFKTIFISILIFSIALFFVLLYSGSTIDNFKINTSQRFDGWILYLNMIMTDNTLIGYGLQGTEKIFETNSLSFKHPHNVYVESLFSLGIIGFLLLLGLTLLYFLRILKMNKKVYNKNISVGLFCSIIIMEQSIGTIWGGNSVIIILLLIFISLNYKQNNYLEKK